MFDDFNWDEWDAQAAEYLASSPDYSYLTENPDYTSWFEQYTPSEPSVGTFIGLDPIGAGGIQGYVSGQTSAQEPTIGYDLTDLGTGLELYGNPIDAYYYDFGRDKNALPSYLSDFQSYLENQPGVGLDGFDELAIQRAADKYVEDMFVADDLKAATLSPEYQARRGVNEYGERLVRSEADSDYAKQLKQMLAKSGLEQLKAKQAYANSGVGKALSGFAMAASLAKLLGGKNEAPTTSARANEGRKFAPTYVGSSAPKTLHAKTGGSIPGGKGGLLSLAEQLATEMMAQRKGLIQGEGGGQDDIVDVKAAPGEYVMDAEVVSALGDGNNEEGARKLDQMRVNIRKHKRTGGLASIPPKAKKPDQYMKKGK